MYYSNSALFVVKILHKIRFSLFDLTILNLKKFSTKLAKPTNHLQPNQPNLRANFDFGYQVRSG